MVTSLVGLRTSSQPAPSWIYDSHSGRLLNEVTTFWWRKGGCPSHPPVIHLPFEGCFSARSPLVIQPIDLGRSIQLASGLIFSVSVPQAQKCRLIGLKPGAVWLHLCFNKRSAVLSRVLFSVGWFFFLWRNVKEKGNRETSSSSSKGNVLKDWKWQKEEQTSKEEENQLLGLKSVRPLRG